MPSNFPPKTLPYQIDLDNQDIFSLISEHDNAYVFIKDCHSVYQYANQPFLKLMGIKSLHKIINCVDQDISRDPEKIKLYREHDAQVLETEQFLAVNELVLPLYNDLITRQMIGSIYPLYAKSSKPVAVMGIVKSHQLPVKLTLEQAVTLSSETLTHYVNKLKYKIKMSHYSISLSRREVHCMIELVKGKHAGEIADALRLKQSTIEFYINNLKDKLGAINRSNLISTIFSEQIIQQIEL